MTETDEKGKKKLSLSSGGTLSIGKKNHFFFALIEAIVIKICCLRIEIDDFRQTKK